MDRKQGLQFARRHSMLFIEARLVSAWVINIYSTAIKDQMVFFLNSHLCNGTRWCGETTMKIIVQGLEEWQKEKLKKIVILCSNVCTFYEKKP